jgi:hypothetical protein
VEDQLVMVAKEDIILMAEVLVTMVEELLLKTPEAAAVELSHHHHHHKLQKPTFYASGSNTPVSLTDDNALDGKPRIVAFESTMALVPRPVLLF